MGSLPFFILILVIMTVSRTGSATSDGCLQELSPHSAELSSVHVNKPARNCIDNNTANFCHTSNSNLPYPWLTVDLGSIKEVKKVVIFNRADCCGDELRDVEVRISNSKPKPGSEEEPFTGGILLGNFDGWGETGQVITVEQEKIIRGRYVVIKHNSKGWLQWLETEGYWDGSLARAREMNANDLEAGIAGAMDIAEVKVFGYLYDV